MYACSTLLAMLLVHTMHEHLDYCGHNLWKQPKEEQISIQTLRGTYLSNAIQQFLEVVCPKRILAFQPLIVHHKSLDDILLQNLSRPNAELGSLVTVHPITYRNNRIQIIQQNALFIAIVRRNSNFSNCCGQLHFTTHDLQRLSL